MRTPLMTGLRKEKDESAGKRAALLCYLPALVPVLLLAVKVKYSVLLSTLNVVSIGVGRKGGDDLGIWEKLSFFRDDVLLGFVLLPACYLLLLGIVPRRFRAVSAAVVNIVLFLLLFATWQCYQQTGQYYSLSTFLDSIWWGWHHPESVGQYVPPSAVAALSLAAASIAGISLWAAWLERRGSAVPGTGRLRQGIACYLVVVLATAVTPGLASHIPATQYHRSIFLVAANTFWGIRDHGIPIEEFTHSKPDELVKRYRDLVHAPKGKKDPSFWGKARGSNVIFFIFETAPERVLHLDGSLDDLPTLKRLRERALVGLRHHTTYPYTNRAWFSIFSSLYPSSLNDNYTDKPGRAFPGVMHPLVAQGYLTKVYYTPNATDDSMFRALGFQSQYLQKRMLPQNLPEDLRSIENDTVQRRRIAEDEATLAVVKSDLEDWLTKNKKFSVAIGPQIGHAPWPALEGTGASGDLTARGHAAIRVQDRWLGELVDLLERHGQLDNTIIVVVGDHGVRTKQEDPAFEGGKIDAYSFQVPLLVYAPQALSRPRAIPWVTSHIDISPTVLDLLGVSEARDREEGSPLWEKNLQNRVTYFFANSYLGADGYTYQGKYYMKNQVENVVYASESLQFGLSNLVTGSAPENAMVTETINRMVALEEVFGKKVAEGNDE